MTVAEPALAFRGVDKRYGETVAVEELSLVVDPGETFGFLGPNGAGKTTAIHLALGFVRPDRGRVEVFGHDVMATPRQVRRRVGVLPEGFDGYDRLTGREHVEFAAASKGVEAESSTLLDRVGLRGDADRRVASYSKGMRQRLLLAMALVGEPELLVLDEPATGLDPAGTARLREVIGAAVEDGATVFFSSHDLTQVEAVCDRVGILRDGRLVADETVETLRDSASARAVVDIRTGDAPTPLVDRLCRLDGVETVDVDGRSVSVSCSRDRISTVIDAIGESPVPIEGITTETSSLEEAFLDRTTGTEVVE
ncbi:ABC transporter ATP-binding protein [Halorubrum tibetense]|uniref:ABC transporter ATP-binding protein n=1 Tax=Halorubrum tibetense TaxID=175631 RepID=A0ABD5S9P9_9EURY